MTARQQGPAMREEIMGVVAERGWGPIAQAEIADAVLAVLERRGDDDAARVTPADIARQRELGWPDFHPEDYCHRCGRPNPNWFAATEQWREATHSTDDGGGILCPPCFCELWEKETGRTAIIWRLSIGGGRDAARRALDGDDTGSGQ